MKLSAFKNHLSTATAVNFVQPNGTFVPRHFHITEAGLVSKNFVDCGGTVRKESAVTFQVWVAADLQHRLEPKKLLGIISRYEKLFGTEDLEVEVEYQSDTVGKYGLALNGENLLLTTKKTDCLAGAECGVESKASETRAVASACCTPGGGCC